MVEAYLMPPVPYCTSCGGEDRETRARDIAVERAEKALETSPLAGSQALSPDGTRPLAANTIETSSVTGFTRPLVAPDLAIQAALASEETGGASGDDDPLARLLAQKAYAASLAV